MYDLVGVETTCGVVTVTFVLQFMLHIVYLSAGLWSLLLGNSESLPELSRELRLDATTLLGFEPMASCTQIVFSNH